MVMIMRNVWQVVKKWFFSLVMKPRPQLEAFFVLP